MVYLSWYFFERWWSVSKNCYSLYHLINIFGFILMSSFLNLRDFVSRGRSAFISVSWNRIIQSFFRKYHRRALYEWNLFFLFHELMNDLWQGMETIISNDSVLFQHLNVINGFLIAILDIFKGAKRGWKWCS